MNQMRRENQKKMRKWLRRQKTSFQSNEWMDITYFHHKDLMNWIQLLEFHCPHLYDFRFLSFHILFVVTLCHWWSRNWSVLNLVKVLLKQFVKQFDTSLATIGDVPSFHYSLYLLKIAFWTFPSLKHGNKRNIYERSMSVKFLVSQTLCGGDSDMNDTCHNNKTVDSSCRIHSHVYIT